MGPQVFRNSTAVHRLMTEMSSTKSAYRAIDKMRRVRVWIVWSRIPRSRSVIFQDAMMVSQPDGTGQLSVGDSFIGLPSLALVRPVFKMTSRGVARLGGRGPPWRA